MNKLKIARLSNGDSLEDVARELKVTTKTYSNWEKGVTRMPADILPLLKRLYKLSDSEILSVFGPREATA